jgi:hypothetical protein
MQFYAYWHQMEPDMYDDNNDGIPDVHYWGNVFYPEPPIVPERNRWYCMEIMIKANDAGQANGEMASWIDGQLYQHLTGFNFRTTDALKLKRISLGIYIHNNPKINTAWFDDAALSTGYIGPVGGTSVGLPGGPAPDLQASIHSGIVKFTVILTRPEEFSLRVCDMSGRMVWDYRRDEGIAGENIAAWDVNEQSPDPGVYVVTAKSGGRVLKKQITLLR